MENFLAMVILASIFACIVVGVIMMVRNSIRGPSDEVYLNKLQRQLDNQCSDSLWRYGKCIGTIFLLATGTFFFLVSYPYLRSLGSFSGTDGIISHQINMSMAMGLVYGLVFGFILGYHLNTHLNAKLAEKRILFREQLEKRKDQKQTHLKIA
jgi:membrane protein DedA with SNARE-associated domain